MHDPSSPPGDPAPPTLGVVLLLLFAALALAEVGWLPWIRYAWGLGLWRYLPAAASPALAAALLALASPRVRARIATAARPLATIATGPRGRLALAAMSAFALWLIRERRLYGDSPILLYNAAAGHQFLFPDIGASYLFQLCYRGAALLGVRGQEVVQALVVASGTFAVLALFRLGESLAPTLARARFVAAFVLSGGFVRIFAGHVEVYAFVLAAAALYLEAALAYMRGRAPLWRPALALGLGLWIHLSFVFLAPSLCLAIVEVTGRSRPSLWLRRWVAAGLASLLPLALFLGLMALAGHTREVEQAGATTLQWFGIVPGPMGHSILLSFADGGGTRYAIGSLRHLKYLANAFFLLHPAAWPTVLGFAALAPRRIVATPEARLLAAAAAPLALYAAILRPVWGPYDWDLFALTAAAAALLAGHLLATALAPRAMAQLGVALIGSSLLLVALPLVAIGISPARPAGPFALELLHGRTPGESPVQALERRLGPWL